MTPTITKFGPEVLREDVEEIDVIDTQLGHSQYVDEESRRAAMEGAKAIDDAARLLARMPVVADVALLLNITPDHMDRYPSFDAYAAATLDGHVADQQHARHQAQLHADRDLPAPGRQPQGASVEVLGRPALAAGEPDVS